MAEATAGREIKKPKQRILKIGLSATALLLGFGLQQHNSRRNAAGTTLFYPERVEPQTRSNGKLRGLTWNIHKGRDAQNKPSLPAIIDTLSHHAFDFACINEATKGDADKIVRALGTYTGIYSPTYANFNPLNRAVEGNLLLISSSLANPRDITVESRKLYQANHGLLPRKVLVAKTGHLAVRQMIFFTTHLEARSTVSNTRQAYQVNQYITTQSPKDAAVIGCGDINANGADRNNPSVAAIAGDQLNITAPGVTFGTSSKIDVFITDPATRVSNTSVIATEASDHNLVVGEFNIYADPL